jgi:mannose-6-phosphate isomerase
VAQTALYPMRFKPICQYRLWGGRRLAKLLTTPLPGEGPIGEAWILSDRDEHPSLVTAGALKGKTIKQLLSLYPDQMLGRLAGRFTRFPLLLKFLDVQTTLSVQVHPSDRETRYIPAGEHGKTEAWVVLEANPKSIIYAGLVTGTTTSTLQRAIASHTVADCLARFSPKPGDAVLVKAGTVHSLSDVTVFEVQENSDVTFRLYDWDHTDAETGKPRPLQVDQALACIDFSQGSIEAVSPVMEETKPVKRERLLACEHFGVWRLSGDSPFNVGEDRTPRVLVCLKGNGSIDYEGSRYIFGNGDVVLLPAVVGKCVCRANGPITVLEISLPEGT